MTTFVDVPLHGLLIGEQRLTASSAGVHGHVFPGTGEVNARVVLAGPEDVDRAVQAAKKAQREWMSRPVDARRDALLALSDLSRPTPSRWASSPSKTTAARSSSAPLTPLQVVRRLRYYAGWIDKIAGSHSAGIEFHRSEHGPARALRGGRGDPAVEWPALWRRDGGRSRPAAGNAVIIKPPELAPLTSLRFGDLALEAGFPPGLVNVLPADPIGSEALVRHPGVDKIHFTGSAAVATRIEKAAADNLTPVSTELGGKSAAVIFDDADLDTAVMLACFSGPLAQSGQNCASGSRILVQDGIVEKVTDRVKTILANTPVGDPRLASTMVGPVISEAAATRILGTIDRAVGAGATLQTGGHRMGGELARGYFIEPTLFTDVDPASELFQEETFGPVASISSFTDQDEAIALVNDSTYGLVNYVHTTNLVRAHTVARELQSGTVFVNTYPDLVPPRPTAASSAPAPPASVVWRTSGVLPDQGHPHQSRPTSTPALTPTSAIRLHRQTL